MGKNKLKIVLLVMTLFFMPVFTFAIHDGGATVDVQENTDISGSDAGGGVYDTEIINVTITNVGGRNLTAVYPEPRDDDSGLLDTKTITVPLSVFKGSIPRVGDNISLVVNKTRSGTVSYVANGLKWVDSANGFKTGGDIYKGVQTYHRLFNLICPSDQALTCWLSAVWGWAQGAVLLLAVGGFITAGVVYMTSAGDPQRTTLAKKIITGSLSAVAVIVLGKFFLTKVIGIRWL